MPPNPGPTSPGPGPLGDLRVLDLTVARAGPTCVRQLADWGADVIRIEPPVQDGARDRHGSDFQNLHRNKRSLALDLRTDDGRAVLLELIGTADVLVENMRPAVKDRLGFGVATALARNPRLIYASISGFGQDGPYRDRGGFDQIVQGMGGLMSVTGTAQGGPTRAGIPVADLSAGLYLAVGILVALHERERTGRGGWVRTSLLEAMIAMLDFQAARWTVDGEVPPAEGNHHPTSVPMGCFPCAEGHLNVGAPSGRLLDRFCAVIGLPELPRDPRFDTHDGRHRNRARLNELITTALAARSATEWVELLNEAGVPAGPVYRIDEMFADPQVAHLHLTEPVAHPALGEVAVIRNAVSITGAPSSVRTPAPDLGEQSEQILRELGMTDERIAELRARGVLRTER
jgi:formyl-CoA transferase